MHKTEAVDKTNFVVIRLSVIIENVETLLKVT